MEAAYSCNIFAVPDSLTCPDIETSWATLASLSILKYWALKWHHRVIRGSKLKVLESCLKVGQIIHDGQEFQKCNYLLNATHGSDVKWLQRSKVSIQIVQGSKNKLLQFSWKWWQIVHPLLESNQKQNTLHYLKCQVTKIWCKKVLLPLAEWWPVTFWYKNIWRRHCR